jgi:polysaccharide transporter, PST family
VNAPVNAVALPLLGRLQNDGPRFNAAFVRMMSTLTSVTLPGIAFLTVMAHEICAVVLGPQWGRAADIFQVLGIASAVQAITNPLGVVMMATGRTDRSFRLALVTTPATIGAFLIGLPYGAIGVARAYAVYTCLSFLPTVWWACRESPVKARAVLASALRPAAVATTVVVALLLFRHALPPETRPMITLLGAGGIAVALWGILHTTVFRTTSPLGLLREMRP